MNRRDENAFRVKPAPPRGQQARAVERFTARVLRAANRIGPMPSRGGSTKPRTSLARLGRGGAAAAFAGAKLGPNARRVVIKSRIVNLKQVTAQAVSAHLRYIAREGVGHDGQPTQSYGRDTDVADRQDFAAASGKDRHQFRFIIAPEDGVELADLREFTRALMATMERDLGTKLEWIAVDHWDTDNPHTHVVLRGRDDRGNDLVIARHYLTDGMRLRASELSTEWLGLRTEREIQARLQRDVSQERWTGLDRQLRALARDGTIDLARADAEGIGLQRRGLLLGRLQVLTTMGLAREQGDGSWELASKVETKLRALGERGDIIKTVHRALHGQLRELVMFDTDAKAPPIVGRIAAIGYMDEINERAYVIVDGLDGRAHYQPIGNTDLSEFPVGGIVEIRPTPQRAADRNIATLSKDGVYKTAEHRAQLLARVDTHNDPDEIVAGHVRRLEALRRAGIVERQAEGVWRVPANLVDQAYSYDRRRTGGVEVQLHSHLPIDTQMKAMGATWLDRKLVEGEAPFAKVGFGAAANEALRNRVDFLIENGFAQRKGDRLQMPSNLLRTLQQRDLDGVAKSLAVETGMACRTLVEGVRTAGVYRRMVVTASGRFAMLDDGTAFSLVPWRPVLAQRIGQHLDATIRGDKVAWSFGRQLGLSR